jgi:hypothetical protein
MSVPFSKEHKEDFEQNNKSISEDNDLMQIMYDVSQKKIKDTKLLWNALTTELEKKYPERNYYENRIMGGLLLDYMATNTISEVSPKNSNTPPSYIPDVETTPEIEEYNKDKHPTKVWMAVNPEFMNSVPDAKIVWVTLQREGSQLIYNNLTIPAPYTGMVLGPVELTIESVIKFSQDREYKYIKFLDMDLTILVPSP